MKAGMFNTGDRVVKILSGGGLETASLQTIGTVTPAFVRCADDEHLKYHPKTGQEIDPAIPGFSSRLIVLETEDEPDPLALVSGAQPKEPK